MGSTGVPEDVPGGLHPLLWVMGHSTGVCKGNWVQNMTARPRGERSSPSSIPSLQLCQAELMWRKRAWKRSLIPLHPWGHQFRVVGLFSVLPCARGIICSSHACQSPGVQQAEDVDELLLGMSSQIAEREDNVVVEDLQGLYCSWAGWGAGPIASFISTQPHSSASLKEVQRATDTRSMCPHRFLVWTPEVLPH